jgi:predicted nucleic acid-binding protein
MKLCIDTCAYSKLALKPPELIDCVDETENIYFPSIVLGELFAGFCMGKKERENRTAIGRFLDLPGVKIVNIDTAIADRYGFVIKQLRKQGTPIPTNDIWIAATALETGSRLLTYDLHFTCVPGLLIVSP